jgi:hypothetical protein
MYLGMCEFVNGGVPVNRPHAYINISMLDSFGDAAGKTLKELNLASGTKLY